MNEPPTKINHPIPTSAQRKAKYRAQLIAGGRQAITGAVTAASATKLKEHASARGCTLGEAIDACVQAAEAAQRKARLRAKMAANGKKVLTVAVGADVVRLAQALARENGRSVADVLELGVKVARRELNAIAVRKAARRQAVEAE